MANGNGNGDREEKLAKTKEKIKKIESAISEVKRANSDVKRWAIVKAAYERQVSRVIGLYDDGDIDELVRDKIILDIESGLDMVVEIVEQYDSLREINQEILSELTGERL